MQRETQKVALVTLGCAKNQVDSEYILGLLSEAGYDVLPVQDAEEALSDQGFGAELCVINTCGFIDAAKEESVEVIMRLASLKRIGKIGRLVVCGCLGQRYSRELLEGIPEVDAVVGTQDFHRIVDVASRISLGERVREAGSDPYRYDQHLPRLRATPPYTAYIKIAEGCNHACGFCAIPQIRGHYRSRPVESVVAEVEELVGKGVREVNLVSQDCTFYGRDITGKRSLLPELLERLNGLHHLKWIRILYNYPMTFDDGIIEAMAGLRKVCKYVDIPLQHGSDRVLAAMKRPGGRADLMRLVGRIRQRMPEAVFRSSFIVGFPGETDEDFADLLRFLEEIRFDYVGFFMYSREEGTPASRLPGQVPPSVKEERYHRAVEIQRAISLERQGRHVGQEIEVLVEEVRLGEGFCRGRWAGQAPEVDGHVILATPIDGQKEFAGNARLKPGDFVIATVSHAEEYDLHAQLRQKTEEFVDYPVK